MNCYWIVPPINNHNHKKIHTAGTRIVHFFGGTIGFLATGGCFDVGTFTRGLVGGCGRGAGEGFGATFTLERFTSDLAGLGGGGRDPGGGGRGG